MPTGPRQRLGYEFQQQTRQHPHTAPPPSTSTRTMSSWTTAWDVTSEALAAGSSATSASSTCSASSGVTSTCSASSGVTSTCSASSGVTSTCSASSGVTSTCLASSGVTSTCSASQFEVGRVTSSGQGSGRGRPQQRRGLGDFPSGSGDVLPVLQSMLALSCKVSPAKTRQEVTKCISGSSIYSHL